MGVDFTIFQMTGSTKRWWKDYVFTRPVMVLSEDADALRRSPSESCRGAADLGVWLIYMSYKCQHCGLSDVVTHDHTKWGCLLSMNGWNSHMLYQS